MKKFVLRLSLFTLLMSSFILGLVFLSDYLMNRNKNKLLMLHNEVYNVFAGNSTLECSINDKLIDHSVNIAQGGEAYLYSYAKVKALLEVNRQIRTVFLSYSYADLLMEKEESWLFSDYFMVEKVQYYNYLLEEPERALLLGNNPEAYFKGVAKSVIKSYENLLRIVLNKKSNSAIPNFGGYKHLERDKLAADPGNDTEANSAQLASEYQIQYLEKISDVCHQNSVRLVLLNPPKHHSYNESLNNNVKQIWINVRQSLPGDSLLDLSSFALADSCFGDLSHLNYKGAQVFSNYLNEILVSSEGYDY